MFEALIFAAAIAAFVYVAGLPLRAIVVLPEGQQRSGSIGGTVWSHNRSGVYIRNRSIPVNPNTDRQSAVRNAVRSLAILWETVLTQNQRDAWDVYAANVSWQNKLGVTISLTGLNHYIRSNTELVTLGFGRIDDAPVIFNLAAAELNLGCAATENNQTLSITFDDTLPWATEVGAFQHFSVGIPQNASRRFFGGPWRYVVSVAGETPAVSPKLAVCPFPFADGQRLWVRSRIMRADGRLSQFAQVNFLATAGTPTG